MEIDDMDDWFTVVKMQPYFGDDDFMGEQQKQRTKFLEENPAYRDVYATFPENKEGMKQERRERGMPTSSHEGAFRDSTGTYVNLSDARFKPSSWHPDEPLSNEDEQQIEDEITDVGTHEAMHEAFADVPDIKDLSPEDRTFMEEMGAFTGQASRKLRDDKPHPLGWKTKLLGERVDGMKDYGKARVDGVYGLSDEQRQMMNTTNDEVDVSARYRETPDWKKLVQLIPSMEGQ